MSDAGSVKTGGQYPLAPPPLRKLTERTHSLPDESDVHSIQSVILHSRIIASFGEESGRFSVQQQRRGRGE
jgi:hypothetical protein